MGKRISFLLPKESVVYPDTTDHFASIAKFNQPTKYPTTELSVYELRYSMEELSSCSTKARIDPESMKIRPAIYISKFCSESPYQGDFMNDERHGFGTFRYANGDVYTGSWAFGYRHGLGAYRFNDDRVLEGIWENGEFMGERIGEVCPPAIKLDA